MGPIIESDRIPVDDHRVYLGVRNANGLDQVLDRLLYAERLAEGSEPALPRKEIVEFRVEAELYGALLSFAKTT